MAPRPLLMDRKHLDNVEDTVAAIIVGLVDRFATFECFSWAFM